MSKLIVQFDGREWEVVLDDRPIDVGRSSKCRLGIKDTALSRDHCKIVPEGGKYIVVDSGSRNGTRVNGKSAQKAILHPGDEVRVGNVTIFFEAKPKAPEPTAAPLPAPQTASGKEETDQRSDRLPHVLNDYLVSSGIRPRRRIGKIVAVVCGVAAAVAVVIVLWNFIAPSGKKTGASTNLLAVNPSFEETAVGDSPRGWRLTGGETRTWMRVERNLSRDGACSLALEKQPAADDFEIACVADRRISVKNLSGIDVTAWGKGEPRSGFAGIRVAWFEGEGDRTPLAEESATGMIEGVDWGKIEGSFRKPAAATEVEIALVTFGRGGTFYFDDVRAAGSRRQNSPDKIALGSFEIALSPNGALGIFRKGRELVANGHLRLVTRDGVSTQLRHTATVADRQEGTKPRLSVSASIVNPVNLDVVPIMLVISSSGGDLSVKYTLPAGRLQQVDRVELLASFPEPKGLNVLEGEGNIPTRISFSSAGQPLVLEYLEVVPLRERSEGGAATFAAGSVVGDGVADIVTGFTLGEPLLSRERDLKAELEKTKNAVEQKRYGECLTLCAKLRRVVTDPAVLKEIDQRLTVVHAVEKGLRKEIALRMIEANVSLRADHVAELEKTTMEYIAMFDGSDFAEDMKAFREEVRKLTSGADDIELERRIEMLEGLAEGFVERGMANLAASAAEKAQQLLDKDKGNGQRN